MNMQIQTLNTDDARNNPSAPQDVGLRHYRKVGHVDEEVYRANGEHSEWRRALNGAYRIAHFREGVIRVRIPNKGPVFDKQGKQAT